MATYTSLNEIDIPADRASLVIAGYTELRQMTEAETAILPSAVEHAALIIAFHRYYRHNIRFPDTKKSHIHHEIVELVEALDLVPTIR